MMEEKGAVATVKELGISSYTLYDWKSKAEGQKYPRRQGPLSGKARKRYTPEFKAEVIAYYQSHGARETLQKYGIVNNSLYNWLDEAGVDRVGSDHKPVCQCPVFVPWCTSCGCLLSTVWHRSVHSPVSACTTYHRFVSIFYPLRVQFYLTTSARRL